MWTLTLRPKVFFQDGNPLDGAALAQTMNYMLANNTSLEPELPGATVTAAGPLTVTLTTAQPTASVASLLANEAMFDIFDTPVYLNVKSIRRLWWRRGSTPVHIRRPVSLPGRWS